MTKEIPAIKTYTTEAHGVKGISDALKPLALATYPNTKRIPFKVQTLFYDQYGTVAYEHNMETPEKARMFVQCKNKQKLAPDQHAEIHELLKAAIPKQPIIAGYPYAIIFPEGSPIGYVCGKAAAEHGK